MENLLFLSFSWFQLGIFFTGFACGALFIFFIISLKKKEVESEEIEDEVLTEEDDSPYYSFSDVRDFISSAFVSKIDNHLRLRFMHRALNKGDEKDGLIISSSYPHKLSDADLGMFFADILQVQSFKIIDSHRIYLIKSPAASFSDFQDKLLTFLFKELHNFYCWQKTKRVVEVLMGLDSNLLTFRTNLNIKSWSHKELLNQLTKIPGLSDRSTNYLFNNSGPENELYLEKRADSSWLEIRPKIIRFFEEYFPAGIIWKGEWEKKVTLNIDVLEQKNSNVIGFMLPENFTTGNHSQLAVDLMNIHGIIPRGNKTSGLPFGMETAGRVFFLEKKEDYSWHNLMRDIKKAFEEYFLAEINFIAYSVLSVKR